MNKQSEAQIWTQSPKREDKAGCGRTEDRRAKRRAIVSLKGGREGQWGRPPQSSPGALNTTHCFPPMTLLQNRSFIAEYWLFSHLTHIKQGSPKLLYHLWWLYYSLLVYIFISKEQWLLEGKPSQILPCLPFLCTLLIINWFFSIFFCTEMVVICNQSITCPWQRSPFGHREHPGVPRCWRPVRQHHDWHQLIVETDELSCEFPVTRLENGHWN